MSRKAVIAVSAVVAIVAAGVALLIAGGGSATADEVRFQTVSEPGPDPFTAPAVATASSDELLLERVQFHLSRTAPRSESTRP